MLSTAPHTASRTLPATTLQKALSDPKGGDLPKNDGARNSREASTPFAQALESVIQSPKPRTENGRSTADVSRIAAKNETPANDTVVQSDLPMQPSSGLANGDVAHALQEKTAGNVKPEDKNSESAPATGDLRQPVPAFPALPPITETQTASSGALPENAPGSNAPSSLAPDSLAPGSLAPVSIRLDTDAPLEQGPATLSEISGASGPLVLQQPAQAKKPGQHIAAGKSDDGTTSLAESGQGKSAIENFSSLEQVQASRPPDASTAQPLSEADVKAAKSVFAPADIQTQPGSPIAQPSSPAPPPELTRPGPSPLTAGPVAQAITLPSVPMVIHAMQQQGNNRFEIRLDPAELGRIDVTLDISNDGTIRTHLIVERPETLQMLRQDAPSLQASLSDSGFKGDSGSISLSLKGGGEGSSGNQGGDQRPHRSAYARNPDDPLPAPARRNLFAPATALDITL